MEIWRGSDFPGKGLLMSWWGETIFSCETYEDEIEANLDMKLSVSWKEFIYKNDVESLLWIPRGWNKAEYGYTDMSATPALKDWSVSLTFHSLVPHASSLSSEGLAGIHQRISGSSHENNKQTWVQLRTMGTRLGQLMIKDRLREVKIVLLRSRHSDDVHTVSVFPEGDRGPRLGVLRHCAGPTRCKTTFCSCQ